MKFYQRWNPRTYIAEQFKNTKILEQGDFPGVELLPSLTIFYDEYPYRIAVKGNRIAYDIKLMADLEVFLNTSCVGRYRFQSTLRNTYLYLEYISDLKILNTSTFIKDNGIKDLFLSYTGPLSVAHRDAIIGVDEKIEVRPALYFGKFDRKLSFSSYMHDGSKEDHQQIIKDISSFLSENLIEGDEYMWYKKYHTYSSNFLYVKDTVWQELGGYFLLQFSNIVNSNVKVVPPSDVI
jgi:hypothetical protein